MNLRLTSSALALAAMTAPAFADVTSEQVWQSWVDYYSSAGYQVTEGKREKAGDTLTIYWENGNVGQVPVTFSFNTTAVPLPAALPLLAGGIAALGIARRRKASTEA